MDRYKIWKGPEDNNSSTLFLLPITNFQLGDFYSNGFVNTFLGDAEMEEETENKILVVLKPTNPTKLETLLSTRIRKNKLYLFEYDVDDFVVLVFDVPKIWEPIISLFKQGKYSLFSEEYKEVYFPKISPITNRASLLHKILYRHEDAFRFLENKYDIIIPREQEAWSKPRCHEEIFRFKKNTKLCWIN